MTKMLAFIIMSFDQPKAKVISCLDSARQKCGKTTWFRFL